MPGTLFDLHKETSAMRARYFWPIILILAGLLFLLDNLGWLPGNAWGWIWAFALILLGVALLWPGRRSAGATEASVPLEGAARARLTLKHGAGQLSLRGGAAPEQLLAGSFGGGVDKEVQRTGDALAVTLRLSDQDWGSWMWPGGWRRGPLDWALNINPTVPLELALEVGASETLLDLADLKVTDLSIKTGASSTRLVLPAQAGHTRVRIEAGAASVRAEIPSGVSARIRGMMGVGALNVDERRFPRRGGEYQSEDYETAVNRAEIEISGGVGSVDVR
jgi:hypothetical protein